MLGPWQCRTRPPNTLMTTEKVKTDAHLIVSINGQSCAQAKQDRKVKIQRTSIEVMRKAKPANRAQNINNHPRNWLRSKQKPLSGQVIFNQIATLVGQRCIAGFGFGRGQLRNPQTSAVLQLAQKGGNGKIHLALPFTN